MGKIFYLMGKSSSGKDTLYHSIKHRMPSLKSVVLYTTRPMRDGEVNGIDYYFIGDEQVKQLDMQNKIIEKREYNTVHGIWKYMTVDDGNFDLENYNYLMIGTLESFARLKEYFGKENIVPLYVYVEDGERLIRAIRREQLQKQPRYEELCRRFIADERDFSADKLEKMGIDKYFNNENKDKCVEELILYIVTMKDI